MGNELLLVLPSHFRSKTDEIWGIAASKLTVIGTYGTKRAGVALGDYVGFSGHDVLIASEYLPQELVQWLFDVGQIHQELRFPNAAATSGRAINDAGDYGGFYRDGDGVIHGFVRLAGGAPERFDLKDADCRLAPDATTIENAVMGINDSGQVVGNFREKQSLNTMGYSAIASQPDVADDKKVAQRTFQFEEPGFVAPRTQARGINNKGEIVGTYLDAKGKRRGWFCSGGVGAPMVPIDFPGADETFLGGINDGAAIAGGCIVESITRGFTGWINRNDMTLQGASAFDVPFAQATVANAIAGNGLVGGFFQLEDGGRRYAFTKATPLQEPLWRPLPHRLFDPHDLQLLRTAAGVQVADRLLDQLGHPGLRDALTHPSLRERVTELRKRLDDFGRAVPLTDVRHPMG